MLSRQRRKIALVDSLTKSDHIQEDNSLPFKQTTGYLLQSNESRVGRTTVEYCTLICTTQSVTLLVAIGSESDNQIVRVSRNACSHRVSCLLELSSIDVKFSSVLLWHSISTRNTAHYTRNA